MRYVRHVRYKVFRNVGSHPVAFLPVFVVYFVCKRIFLVKFVIVFVIRLHPVLAWLTHAHLT